MQVREVPRGEAAQGVLPPLPEGISELPMELSLPCHFHRFTVFVRHVGGDGVYESIDLRRCSFAGCTETKEVRELFR